MPRILLSVVIAFLTIVSCSCDRELNKREVIKAGNCEIPDSAIARLNRLAANDSLMFVDNEICALHTLFLARAMSAKGDTLCDFPALRGAERFFLSESRNPQAAELFYYSALAQMKTGRNYEALIRFARARSIAAANDSVLRSRIDFSVEHLRNAAALDSAELILNSQVAAFCKDERAKKSIRDTYTFIIIIVALSALCIVVAFVLRHRTQRNEFDTRTDAFFDQHRQLLSLLDKEDEKISQSERERASMLLQIRALIGKEYEAVDRLCNIYFEYQGTKKEQNKIYEEVISLFDRFADGSSEIQAVEKAADEMTGNVISRLREEMPTLNDWEYSLFLFNVLDFSPRAISIFQGTTVQIVYGRKNALKRKIKAALPPSADDFLSYLK